MQGVTMTRRAVLRTALGALGACSVSARRLAGAAPPELALPASTPKSGSTSRPQASTDGPWWKGSGYSTT
jgi:hypothetical protein